MMALLRAVAVALVVSIGAITFSTLVFPTQEAAARVDHNDIQQLQEATNNATTSVRRRSQQQQEQRSLLGGLTNCNQRLVDRTTSPILKNSSQAVQTVVETESPPGNIAVSSSERIFFTFFPSKLVPLLPGSRPPKYKVVELVYGSGNSSGNGGPIVPFPNEHYQQNYFNAPLSVRIDRFDRLWVLDDPGFDVTIRPKLTAFDIETRQVVHEHQFSIDEACVGSFLNDFHVSPDGTTIYLVDTSTLANTPAILIYDVTTQTTRRVLENDDSVIATPNGIYVDVPMSQKSKLISIFGIIPITIAVDSIALDTNGIYLYYKPLNGGTLYRIPTADLLDNTLTDADLKQRIEIVGETTMSDGITIDTAGNIYMTDMEHSAITRWNVTTNQLETLLKDTTLFRWPDGFSWGPNGYLYFTCSSLQDVLPFGMTTKIKKQSPYQIYRFQPPGSGEGVDGIPGH